MSTNRPISATFTGINFNWLDSIVDLWQQFDRSLQKRKIYEVDPKTSIQLRTFENIQLAAALLDTDTKTLRKVIRDELEVAGKRYVFASRVNIHE